MEFEIEDRPIARDIGRGALPLQHAGPYRQRGVTRPTRQLDRAIAIPEQEPCS